MTFHHSKQHEFLDVIMVSVRAIDILPFHKEHATQHMHLMKCQQKIDSTLDPTSTEKQITSIHQVQPSTKNLQSYPRVQHPLSKQHILHSNCHFFPSKLSSSASCWLRLQGPTAFGKTEADDGRGFHNECLYRGSPRGSNDGNSKKNPGFFVSSVHRIFGEVWRYLIYWFPAKNSK